jgi:hypothetical protein
MVRVDANLKKIFEQAKSPRIPTRRGQLGRLPFRNRLNSYSFVCYSHVAAIRSSFEALASLFGVSPGTISISISSA